MSTLTIFLLIYVIADILVDITALICLRKQGYSLRDIAFKIKGLFTCKKPTYYDDEDLEDYDNECNGWDEWEEDPYTDDHYEDYFYDENEEFEKIINKVTENE